VGVNLIWLNRGSNHCLRGQLQSDRRGWRLNCCLGCLSDYHDFVGTTKLLKSLEQSADHPPSALVIASLFIVDPKDVVRDDGTHIAIFKKPTMKTEVSGVLSVLTDPKIVILLPAMFVGEMCLALTSSITVSTCLPS
jgi:hypothetical protein